MSQVSMNLYEALSKKKILESRVAKIDNRFRLVDIKKVYEDVSSSGLDLETVKADIMSTYLSTVALINNLASLKAAINEANARIQVEIAGKKYSIADAISRLRSLDTEESLYKRMLNNVTLAEAEIQKHKDKFFTPEAVSQYVSKILGDSKKDEDLITGITKQYHEKYEYELFDPLNTKELAENKLKEIADFREEIHFKLVEANCSNTIVVEFED